MLHMFNSMPFTLSESTFWLPKAASTLAPGVDRVFYFILYLSILFFALVIFALIYFSIKYRKKDSNQKTSSAKGDLKLEIAWSVVPSILLIVIFVWGFLTWMNVVVPPGQSLDIRVVAQKWVWSFEYPKAGIVSPELVVPVGQPIRLTMYSKDVIHSFFVPEFRIKKDVLPNRYSVVWFQATDPGEYQVFCTEYCGTGHSQMLTKVRVLMTEEYQAWLDSGGGAGGNGMSSAEFGKTLFSNQGCMTCHSINGTTIIGPSLLGKYGSQEKLTNGSTITIDDNYIRESLMEPTAKVVYGFTPTMPTYKGRLSDKQINALIDYIKSLGKGT